jgi:hypothetical protein
MYFSSMLGLLNFFWWLAFSRATIWKDQFSQDALSFPETSHIASFSVSQLFDLAELFLLAVRGFRPVGYRARQQYSVN